MQLPHLEEETRLWQQGLNGIVGVDEVGRGCLAGPVIAAAVLLPSFCPMLAGVNDSKKLSRSKREKLFAQIQQQALAIGIGQASVEEINTLNILHATYLAMFRALLEVKKTHPYDFILIDGGALKTTLDFGAYRTLVGGDASSYSIACASIIAKVTRDNIMEALAVSYPYYGWEKNAGYGTKQHLAGLEEHGVTPVHRVEYAPIKAHLSRLL